MTPTDTLVFICILFIVLFVGAIIVIGGNKAQRKRARGGDPVFAPMNRGHAGPDMLKGKEWRPSQFEINTQKYSIPNWDSMDDTELAEAIRCERPYAEWMKGK